MEQNNETFSYTYSANKQEDIKDILKKYMPTEEDKATQIRRLDKGVTSKATTISLVVGILSSLVLGVGMCCCMVWSNLFMLGIFVGIIGIAGMVAAYPLYRRVLIKEREKIAPQIIELSKELV